MFNALIAAFAQQHDIGSAHVRPEGLDVQLGDLFLHVREHQGLLTAFMALSHVQPIALSRFGDWPVLNLSPVENSDDVLLWAREWVDRLDPMSLGDLIERLLDCARMLQGNDVPVATSLAQGTFR